MSNSASHIHKVALVGHSGVGKTSLAEALLASGGAIPRKGRVEEGNTICDFEPEELKRHASVSLAIAQLNCDDHKINLLDTPGFADFISEVDVALEVADLAVVVVSAVAGVEVQTEVVWRLAQLRNLPRLIFVNKLDHEQANFELTIEDLRQKFGDGIAPLELPIGIGPEFRGVADLLADRATVYNSGVPCEVPVPTDIAELEHRVHDDLVEGIIVADDTLMERYLEGETPSVMELEEMLASGIADATVFPVLCGSATSDIGIDRLASFICEVSHNHRTHVLAGDKDLEIESDPNAEPLARIFKTTVDPFVGRISLLEVISGTLRPDMVLIDSRTHAEQKLHVLQSVLGKNSTPMAYAEAGDIVAVSKLNDVHTGDTLAPKSSPVSVPAMRISAPVLEMAIRPKSARDEDRLMDGLHRLQEEDLALNVERHDETHQTILAGLGETHLQVALERLMRKFNVEVDAEDLKIPYRETITRSSDAEGRYKKQTGGHGQFGVVHLRIDPLERGQGFEFVDQIVGGAIPRQFISAVEKGVQRAMRQSGLFGFPVVDVRVTCDDGRFHSVDSSEASFDQAGALAFSEAFRRAEPIPLEPLSRLEVTIPAEYLGKVLGDINARRARVLSSTQEQEGDQVIVALVPTNELLRYAIDLRSLSGGRGHFSTTHDHFEPVPRHLVDKLFKEKVLTS